VGDDYEADIVRAKKIGMKTIFLSKESPVGVRLRDVLEKVLEIMIIDSQV